MFRFICATLILFSATSSIFFGITHFPIDSLSFHQTLQIGRGNIRNLEWHPDGEMLLVDTITGTWLYTDTLQDIVHLPNVFHGTFSSDGQWLAGTDSHNHIVLYNPQTFEQIMTLNGHHHEVVQLAWHPGDSNVLATVDKSGQILVWDMRDKKQYFKNRQFEDVVKIAWNPSGEMLAEMGSRGEVAVWDIPNSQIKFILGPFVSGAFYTVFDFAWRNDTTLVRIGTGDGGETEAWDIYSNLKLPAIYTQGVSLRREIVNVSISPDTKLEARGGYVNEESHYEAIVRIIDSATQNILFELPAHYRWFGTMTWSADSLKLASTGIYGDLQTWNIGKRLQLGSSTLHAIIGGPVTWSNDGSMVATSSYTNAAHIWDAKTGNLLATLEGHSEKIFRLAWQPSGTLLATSSRDERSVFSGQDNTVYIWDTSQFNETQSIAKPTQTLSFGEAIMTIAWSPDGSHLAIVGDEHTIYIWDAHSADIVSIDIEQITGWCCPTILDATWSYRSDILAVSAFDVGGTLYLFDVTSGQVRGRNALGNYTWTPENELIWANWGNHPHGADFENSIYVGFGYSLSNSSSLPYKKFFMSSVVYGIYFTQDGTHMAGIDYDRTLTTWNTETGQPHLNLDDIQSVVWSPDGLLLTVLQENRPARIVHHLSSMTFDMLNALEYSDYYRSGRDSISWSPDSRNVAAIVEGTLIIWESETRCQVPHFLRGIAGEPAWCGNN